MLKKFIIIILSIFFLLLFIAPYTLNKQDGIFWYLKLLIPENVKLIIKKSFLQKEILNNEIKFLKNALQKSFNDDYILKFDKKLKLIEEKNIASKFKELNLNKFYLPFNSLDAMGGKPVGYIDKFKNYLIIASGRGEFVSIDTNQFYKKKIIEFSLIDTNFYEFVDPKELYLPTHLGIRDIHISGNVIYVSYPKKINEGCFNISILHAEMNLKKLNFEEFFSHSECIGTFFSTRSGGRIQDSNDDIFFTIGDYGAMTGQASAQNLKNYFGKVISINKKNKTAKIISYGHRNPQGLLYIKNLNLLLETEHGPNGGDELNFIDLNKNEVANYGWPISSYGEHYPGTIQALKKLKKYDELLKSAPLHKSHKKFGFIEPLINWTPSIGVSEIIKFNDDPNDNSYLIAAMGNNIPEGDMTLHHYNINKKFTLTEKLDTYIIGERIRDLVQYKGKIFMILENSPALGVLDFKK